jgi:tRNA threonylcarbamoyladenosine biosynthesis protein TsaE
METRQITTLDELAGIAQEVVSFCTQNEHAQVIALIGDLGAGKTAFTKELAKLLGIAYEITSPTFVIMKSYEIPAHPFFKKLVHIDAYRIEADDEMRVLGFNEILSDPTNLVCIEWPEKIENLIPKDAYTVSLTLNLDETRTITYGKSN